MKFLKQCQACSNFSVNVTSSIFINTPPSTLKVLNYKMGRYSFTLYSVKMYSVPSKIRP